MGLEQTIAELENFEREKSFNTRGLPLTKKLWRDGYNKAIQEIIIHFKIIKQNTDQDGSA